MGRKSREKRERRALKERSVSTHDIEIDERKYRMQEWHPDGSDPISNEQFEESSIIAQVGHSNLELLLQKTIDRLGRKRIMVIVPETYVAGEHPITIAVYPKLTERQAKTFKSIINEIKG